MKREGIAISRVLSTHSYPHGLRLRVLYDSKVASRCVGACRSKHIVALYQI